MSGRKDPCLERERVCVDIADDQEIIVPWLLIVSVIKLAVKTLRLWDYTAIFLFSRNSPPPTC